jgi:hypothetical protein
MFPETFVASYAETFTRKDDYIFDPEAKGRRESNRVAGVEVPGSGLRGIGHVNSSAIVEPLLLNF